MHSMVSTAIMLIIFLKYRISETIGQGSAKSAHRNEKYTFHILYYCTDYMSIPRWPLFKVQFARESKKRGRTYWQTLKPFGEPSRGSKLGNQVREPFSGNYLGEPMRGGSRQPLCRVTNQSWKKLWSGQNWRMAPTNPITLVRYSTLNHVIPRWNVLQRK